MQNVLDKFGRKSIIDAMLRLTRLDAPGVLHYVARIGVFLSNAELDAKARQNMADILNAAVKIGEVALKVAVKLTA